MPADLRCELCAWWETDIDSHTLGECRASSPKPNTYVGVRGVWPLTEHVDWCRRFTNRHGESAWRVRIGPASEG